MKRKASARRQARVPRAAVMSPEVLISTVPKTRIVGGPETIESAVPSLASWSVLKTSVSGRGLIQSITQLGNTESAVVGKMAILSTAIASGWPMFVTQVPSIQFDGFDRLARN